MDSDKFYTLKSKQDKTTELVKQVNLQIQALQNAIEERQNLNNLYKEQITEALNSVVDNVSLLKNR